MVMSVSKTEFRLPISTPDGVFFASYSTVGLCGMDFPERAGNVPAAAADAAPAGVLEWHGLTTRALGLALRGSWIPKLPPLDLSGGTPFQQSVWNTLRQIAVGHTLSYGEVARSVGRPQAVRAVGGACGANPVPVLIPCHRVLAARQRLGGFSGGLSWKLTLLAREGISFSW